MLQPKGGKQVIRQKKVSSCLKKSRVVLGKAAAAVTSRGNSKGWQHPALPEATG